ncbi:MAG TPA: glycerol acyltransferase [Hellea balneolensis]|uniref:Glycerol acyltransferase n=1 Tax=Hellea balneolensis TaxID=287478 RepID=A0A7C5R1R7_9PROT|nr:glycerol acyltransferase [Hellea balneolensis]
MTNDFAPHIQTAMINPEDHIPASAPRLGNGFTRFLGRVLMKMLGYHFEGRFPDEKKMVLIASPHTTAKDLALAIATILSLGVKINFMMKKEAFVFPLKGLFVKLGGIPVDRANPKRVTIQILKTFRDSDKMWLAILPEGTRQSVDSWKTGFKRIADKAGVPIFIMGVDSRKKALVFDRLMKEDETIEDVRLYSKDKFTGINPEYD